MIFYLKGIQLSPCDIGHGGDGRDEFARKECIVMSRGRKVHRQRHVEREREDGEVPFAEHGVQCT